MKLPQISMIIGLAVLLNFSIPTTWANKKTAIIAGSAGGGAAAVVGGVLWYKLRGGVRYYYDGELLNVKGNDLDQVIYELRSRGFSLAEANMLTDDIDKVFETYESEFGKSVDVYIDLSEDGRLIVSMKSDNRYVIKNHVAGEELTIPTKSVNTTGELDNLKKIDGNITSQSADSTGPENGEQYTESTNIIDNTDNLGAEAGNLGTEAGNLDAEAVI